MRESDLTLIDLKEVTVGAEYRMIHPPGDFKITGRSCSNREDEPTMPTIHPSAVIEGDVQLADDVVVGPHSVISGTVRIGSGTRLIAQCYVTGYAELGKGNTIWPGAVIGGPPQDLNFDHDCERPGLIVGDDNMFREGVTVHRGKTSEPTRIGNNNYFMTNTHIGHDSVLGNNIQMATGSMLGGHTIIDDRVIIGGGTAMHQFCRAGYGAFLSGGIATPLDIPPWFTLTSIGVCGSINIIGMRRSGMTTEEIGTRKWVFRTLYRQRRSIKNSLETLKLRADDPVVTEYIDFIESSDRGICWGTNRNHVRK